MTKLEREYLISLRESEQLAAGPELEKAAELDNEATLEKAPSELVSTIDNGDVYGDDEEMAEDVGEVVVECYNFLMESSDEEFNNLVERLNESEIDFCLSLLENEEILTEAKRDNGTAEKVATGVTGGVGAAAGGALAHSGVRGAIVNGLRAIGGGSGAAGLGKIAGVVGGGLAGAAALGAGAYGVTKAVKAIKNERAARKKAADYYRDGKKLTLGTNADGSKKEIEYNYANRKYDRKDRLLQNKLKHSSAISNAKDDLKYAKKDKLDQAEIDNRKQALKNAKRAQDKDARVIKREEKLKAKLARNQARKSEASERRGHGATLTESFSDLDLMYMLEEAGYEASLDNLILLKEGFETGEWTVIYECNYTDYELCEILDENGYEVSDENVEILREGFINGTYTI